MFSIKYLLILLFTASFLLAGCSSLLKSGMDGYTSQSDDLTVKKERDETKDNIVVLHAYLPVRESSEKKDPLRYMNNGDTGRFSVKEVLWGSYDESFIELTLWMGEFVSLFSQQWQSGEYVLFLKRKCPKNFIQKIGACDDGYVDARKPLPNNPVHLCEEKVCKPSYAYGDAFSSKVLHDVGGISFIVNTNSVEYFQKQWSLRVEHFESEDQKAFKGIRFDSLRKCLKAEKCLPP